MALVNFSEKKKRAFKRALKHIWCVLLHNVVCLVGNILSLGLAIS